jgi:protein gp37
MASSTQIEWTDATWNPVTGCTKITRGCDFCYAERFSERFRGVPGHPFENGFDLKLRPERLTQPLSWRQPRRIFVNSMSDLFHKEIPRSFIDSIFDTMEAADWHTFQVLTKRSSLMVRYLRNRYGASKSPSHIWLKAFRETEYNALKLNARDRAGAKERKRESRSGSTDLFFLAWTLMFKKLQSMKSSRIKKHWHLTTSSIFCANSGRYPFRDFGR